jgi:hypothetical protein
MPVSGGLGLMGKLQLAACFLAHKCLNSVLIYKGGANLEN